MKESLPKFKIKKYFSYILRILCFTFTLIVYFEFLCKLQVWTQFMFLSNGPNWTVFLNLEISLYFISEYACICIRICHGGGEPQTIEETVRSPGAGITGSSQPWHGCWEPNSGSLEEWQILLSPIFPSIPADSIYNFCSLNIFLTFEVII